MKLRALLLGFALAGAGCVEYQTEPLPLAITISADKLDTVVGDSIRLVLTGQGGSLDRFFVDWGDGTNSERPTLGARTATDRPRKAYSVAGTYTIKATLHDTFAGQKSDSLSIRIR